MVPPTYHKSPEFEAPTPRIRPSKTYAPANKCLNGCLDMLTFLTVWPERGAQLTANLDPIVVLVDPAVAQDLPIDQPSVGWINKSRPR